LTIYDNLHIFAKERQHVYISGVGHNPLYHKDYAYRHQTEARMTETAEHQ